MKMGDRAIPAMTRALAAGLVVAASSFAAEEPTKPKSAESERPISDSVERILDRLDEQMKKPCRKADADKVPCFPVSVEAEEPRFSVRESIESYAPGKGQRSGRPPTTSAWGSTVVPFLSFDPVCTTRSVVKKLKGKNDTYYLYRFRDRTGTRPVLTDRPLDLRSYADRPDVQFELLEKLDGECAAVAAFRHAERAGAPR